MERCGLVVQVSISCRCAVDFVVRLVVQQNPQLYRTSAVQFRPEMVSAKTDRVGACEKVARHDEALASGVQCHREVLAFVVETLADALGVRAVSVHQPRHRLLDLLYDIYTTFSTSSSYSAIRYTTLCKARHTLRPYLCPTFETKIQIVKNSYFYSAPQCSHCKRCTSYSNSVCLSVCLCVCESVCLSHAGIVSKRLHVARCSLLCHIAKCIKFCRNQKKIFPRHDPFP